MNINITQGHLHIILRYIKGQDPITANYLRSSPNLKREELRSCGFVRTDIRDFWREVIIPPLKQKYHG
jgi:hypothetical protein